MPLKPSLNPSRECDPPDRSRALSMAINSELNSQELSSPAIQRMFALGQMSRGFVHDFRNILAVISAGLNLAKRHESDVTLSSRFLAGAQEGVDRGLRMTARLLDFASGHDCEVDAANVNDALRQLQTLLRYAVGPDIHIVMQFDQDVPNFDFDLPQFNAAIMNLVVNARDAMLDGGSIHISTGLVFQAASQGPTSGSYVRVRVRDDGMGMTADVRRRILDPFFTTKAGTGTGLGLPQVDNFVRQAGGFMRIDTALGVGSTFDLFFPYDAIPREERKTISHLL